MNNSIDKNIRIQNGMKLKGRGFGFTFGQDILMHCN